MLSFLLPQGPAMTNLHFVSMDLSVLDILYKWNHIIIHDFVSTFFHLNIHIVACILYPLLWLIFHCIYIIIYLFIHWWTFGLFPVTFLFAHNNLLQTFARLIITDGLILFCRSILKKTLTTHHFTYLCILVSPLKVRTFSYLFIMPLSLSF